MGKPEIKELESEVEIINPKGIHARPCSSIAQLSEKFLSDIYLVKNDMRVNAKSILGIMTLGAPYGTKLKVEIKGPDAEEAMKAIKELFASGFGEM